MRKLFILAITLFLVACGEQGSYWNKDTTQMKSDKVGRLEATGEDLRVYEFTPQSSPNKECVFVAGDSKAGLFCYDKK